ncbi:MAG: apolipoprotein N-acyltransferase [Spirochaetaceae bacterium]|jgi:apolipoprotein N-acyltransferase|nr:apolipoprotein N-acyltransferase [Spirochaetaceae bacterium]
METIGIKTPAFPAAPREIIIWAVLFVVSLVYGLISINHYNKLQTDAPDTAKIALVQPNLDPWRGGLPAYKANYAALKRLSDEAIASSEAANENAGLDLVVWPETAFVPRIYWHTHYRDDPPSYALVKELLDYLASQDVPFLLGNDDARREVQPNGQYERVDYNAALLFEKGEEKGIYRKMRLVPFTEHFPYKDILPGVYQILLDADTHMWKAGVDPTVFKVDKFNFSTPICFEDCFGYISREFVQNGADILVNITNDAWSQSLSAQMQHATMAAFRAVENRKPIVRSTASGQTCAFSPTGKLLAMAEPFCETFLLVDLPILRGEGSLYTEAGDILGLLAAIFSLGILLFGGISCIIKKRMKK